MQAKLCDRCGAAIKEKRKEITKCVSDWDHIFERLDHIKVLDGRNSLIGYLDLCDTCKREFIDWIHQGSLHTK